MKLIGASLSVLLLATVEAAEGPLSSSRATFARRSLQAGSFAELVPEQQQQSIIQATTSLNRDAGRRFLGLERRNFRWRGREVDESVTAARERKEQGFESTTTKLASKVLYGGPPGDQTIQSCDQALLGCLPEAECAECFRYLYGQNIDWGTVTPDTECRDVVDFLAAKKVCTGLKSGGAAMDIFCTTFHSCAVWDEVLEDDDVADNDNEDTADDDEFLDCDSLTECSWPGIHTSFLGDGICHDFGCYNTAVCGYDKGDCCEDSCVSHHLNYVDCGHDGYACRDPNSTKCDTSLTLTCPKSKDKKDADTESNPDPADTKCAEGEQKYMLVLYDSFGDGWDQTKMTIHPENNRNSIIFNGGLKSGHEGTRYICLSKSSTCYHAEVTGGEWGNEVSWEVKPMNVGAPTLAGGGAPMSCDFAVGGAACDNTCTGKPNILPNDDPQYKEFKDMYNCIEQKCIIQVGACEKDSTCRTCMEAEKNDYCYGNDVFIALVDCTMCKCTTRAGSEFCDAKVNPHKQPAPNSDPNAPGGGSRTCSSAETQAGSDAVLRFATCTSFDEVSMMVTDYDENQFGDLDKFEACSHSFSGDENHGGHTALGCMQILVNAMHSDVNDEANPKAEAISALAGLLYQDAENFCECASKASADCPMCSSFKHVKTLLYESLDACHSLDEIDCDAWTEFQAPCKKNLIAEFGSINFNNEEQCKYVHSTCGGAGPFPAFRKLDCGSEDGVPKPAWDMYIEYSRACLKHDPDGKPQPKPTSPTSPTIRPYPPPQPNGPTPGTVVPIPSPTKAPVPIFKPTGNRPTPKPYVPSEPYVPYDSKGSSSSGSYSSGSDSSSHWMRNLFFVAVIGGAGLFYYKRRQEQFSFVRYRTTRNYAGGESEMYTAPYSGLASSTSFQPPSLPPTPSAVDG